MEGQLMESSFSSNADDKYLEREVERSQLHLNVKRRKKIQQLK